MVGTKSIFVFTVSHISRSNQVTLEEYRKHIQSKSLYPSKLAKWNYRFIRCTLARSHFVVFHDILNLRKNMKKYEKEKPVTAISKTRGKPAM